MRGFGRSSAEPSIFKVPTLAARQGTLPSGQVTIKPEVVPYLALFPLPNGRDFSDGTAEYSTPTTRNTRENFGSGRYDQQVSDSQSFFVRYTYSNASDSLPQALSLFQENGTSKSQFLTSEWKSIVSKHFLNVARIGMTRHNLRDTEAALVGRQPEPLGAARGVHAPIGGDGSRSAGVLRSASAGIQGHHVRAVRQLVV